MPILIIHVNTYILLDLLISEGFLQGNKVSIIIQT